MKMSVTSAMGGLYGELFKCKCASSAPVQTGRLLGQGEFPALLLTNWTAPFGALFPLHTLSLPAYGKAAWRLNTPGRGQCRSARSRPSRGAAQALKFVGKNR